MLENIDAAIRREEEEHARRIERLQIVRRLASDQDALALFEELRAAARIAPETASSEAAVEAPAAIEQEAAAEAPESTAGLQQLGERTLEGAGPEAVEEPTQTSEVEEPAELAVAAAA